MIGTHRSGRVRRLALAAVLVLISRPACSPPARPAVIILCAGDSLTDSAYPRDLRRLLARDGFAARVLNFGRKGDTSGEYRRFLAGRREALAAERPDFVLRPLGTNAVRLDGDRTSAAAFAANMRAIVEIFGGFADRHGGRTVLLLGLIPPVPETAGFPFGPESRQRVGGEINPLLRQIAREKGLALVDNHAPFLGSPELLPGVHPSREGYRLLARGWRDALLPLVKK